MSELKPKLNEFLTEIESFILEVSGRINGTLDTIEDFAPAVLGELNIISPEIKSVQAEIGTQIEKMELDIDDLTK